MLVESNSMNTLIAVSGFPGSGKTSLVCSIAKEKGWARIHYDDFDGMTSRSPENVLDWIAAGMPLDELFIMDFRSQVLNALEIGSVVVETPLGRLHETEGLPVDLSIWLECEYDVALARAFLKEITSSDWPNIAQLQDWAKGYLAAYPSFVAQTLRKQASVVKPLADVVLDTSFQPSTKILSDALFEINRYISNRV